MKAILIWILWFTLVFACSAYSAPSQADYWLRVQSDTYFIQKRYISYSDCLKEQEWLMKLLKNITDKNIAIECVEWNP